MRNENQTQVQPRKGPRLQRTAAAVIAQYIQDLTHPVKAMPCTPGA